MTVQEFTLEEGDWKVTVFYAPSPDTLPLVITRLWEVASSPEDMDVMVSFLEEDCKDCGLTCTSVDRNESVLIIGEGSSAEEFSDTFDHEKGHLAMHICAKLSITPFSERFQYLAGDIAKAMYPVAIHYMCPDCRQ